MLSNRDLIDVWGPDAPAYLQGQLSQDIAAIESGSSAFTFILSPAGKIDSWFRVHRTGDTSFVLDVEAGFGDAVVERLRRFLIRTDADIGSVTPGRMASLRGEDAGRPTIADERSVYLISDIAWPEFEGIDVLWRPDRGEQLPSWSALNVDGRPDMVEEMRVRAGVPRLGAEILSGSIPAESGRATFDLSVSLTKGCYTGQELVARMHSRGGQAPNRLRRLTAAKGVEVGAEVIVDEVIVGLVTSAVGPYALAVLTRKIGPGDSVSVAGASAVVAAVPGDDLSENSRS